MNESDSDNMKIISKLMSINEELEYQIEKMKNCENCRHDPNEMTSLCGECFRLFNFNAEKHDDNDRWEFKDE